MKNNLKHPGFWFCVIVLATAIALLIGVRYSRAGEPIEYAYINAPGQLVVVTRVENFGIVHKRYTVVYVLNEPTFCKMSGDSRYVVYTENALIVDPEPIDVVPKLCGERKCEGGK